MGVVLSSMIHSDSPELPKALNPRRYSVSRRKVPYMIRPRYSTVVSFFIFALCGSYPSFFGLCGLYSKLFDCFACIVISHISKAEARRDYELIAGHTDGVGARPCARFQVLSCVKNFAKCACRKTLLSGRIGPLGTRRLRDSYAWR